MRRDKQDVVTDMIGQLTGEIAIRQDVIKFLQLRPVLPTRPALAESSGIVEREELTPPPTEQTPATNVARRAGQAKACTTSEEAALRNGVEAEEPAQSNVNVTAGSAEGVRIGRTLCDPFTATDLRARLDGGQSRCYNWIVFWKARGWVETVGYGQFKRTATFGEG